MSDCNWEAIPSFDTIEEFNRFHRWINNQCEEGVGSKFELPAPPAGKIPVTVEERYKHIASGQVWRLVFPDFPFRGVWERAPELKKEQDNV